MALDTDLSRKPYFDDYDVTKNFYRVLYRPAVAVQARELNQMQSILQDQIDKFGRHIFKDGSVVEGCAFTFDNNYEYVKIKDTYSNNSTISSLADFQDRYVYNSNGLKALVVNNLSGYESQAPDLNTLYIKYLNAGTYANGDVQKRFSNAEVLEIRSSSNVNIGNVVVATVVNSAGKGYAFTTTEGVIFKKGFFIRVEPQTLVVTKYDNVPDNISVGFDAVEEIVTPEIDTSLLDNAAGSPNYDAPGAYRLKLVPTLVTRDTDSISNTDSFFSLCDFKDGLPVTIKNDPQYAVLEKEMARRTFETNGDFVVEPFLLSTENKIDHGIANTTYMRVLVSRGLGYVKGHRVEFTNNNSVRLRKGTDYREINNQVVTSKFGYYLNVNEFCGDFNNDSISQVEIHNVAKTALTSDNFLDVAYSTSTKIGTAYVRGVAYDTGTPGVDATYLLYLFNVEMSAGYGIADARSIIRYSGGSVLAVADIILDKDFSNNDIAKIQDSASELAVYPFGQKAIKPDGFSTTGEYVYRNRANATVQTSGSFSLTLPSAVGTGTESFNYGTGYLTTNLKESFIVIPSSNGFSVDKTGTVVTTSNSANVTANSANTTSFTSDYAVGDYIQINATTNRRITSITNATHMVVDSVVGANNTNVTHRKMFPAGVPINFAPSSRTIEITSGSTANVYIGEANVLSTFGISAYFDIARSSTLPISKRIQKSTYIKIQANTNPGGAQGPWCLGLPDVLRINAIYLDSSGGTYSTSNPEVSRSFALDTGQRDAFYGLAYISSLKAIAPNATLLVDVDNYTFDTSQGVGYFTAASYPIDDANTANTSAIRTYEIQQYNTTLGNVVDLRDSIDFRPYAVNTAVANASSIGTATVNPSNTLTLYSYGANGSYLPTPDSRYQSDIAYYLPRKDRISLTTSGSVVILEGDSAINPVPPPEVPGTMTIGFVTVPQYPSLTPTIAKSVSRYDYAVQTSLLQTRRWTMADINSISKRIDRLEYYTSLSLLEQATSSLLVRSDNTGQNRFKNGILVDPFKDHTIGDTANPKYTIAIDREKSEARPYFMQMTVGMNFDAEASTAVRRGALIMLPYTANNINQSQPFASKYRNCIEGNIFNYRGTVTLNPAAITDSDITQNPVINGNLDLYTNFMTKTTSKRSAFGSEWGNWSNYGSPSVVQSSSETRLSGSKTMPGRIENTFTETTTKTLAQQQVQVNKNLVVNRTENTVELGNFVSDVSIQPFVPARQVYFEARGLKPNCRLYVFFDRVNVTDRCMQIVRYRGSIETIGGVNYTAAGNRCYFSPYGDKFRTVGDWTAPLYSDDNGNIFGVFAIPAGIFKAGDLQFKITDIPNQLEGEDAVTTQASTTLFCAALSLEKTRANLTVISPQLDIEEEKQFRTVYQDVITDRTWTSIETVTIVDEPVDNGPVDGGGDGGDGGDDGVVQDNETDVTPDGGDDGTVTILPTDTGDEVVVSTPEIVTPPIVEISDSVVVCYDMPPPVEDNTSWQGDYSENTNEAAVDASQTGTDTPGDGDDAGDSAGAGDAAGGDDGGGGGAG